VPPRGHRFAHHGEPCVLCKGSSRPHQARNLCETCYARMQRAGRLDEFAPRGNVPRPPSLPDQLATRGWDVVDGGCWILRGAPNKTGFLYVANNNRRLTAGRAAFLAWREPIPAGHNVFTKCPNNGRCINPLHLELREIGAPGSVPKAQREAAPDFQPPVRYKLTNEHRRTIDAMLRGARAALLSGELSLSEFGIEIGQVQVFVDELTSGRRDADLRRVALRPRTLTVIERVEQIGWDVDEATGCWLWRGWIHSTRGYALVRGLNRTVTVARILFQARRGVLGEDERLRRTCRRPACVNPTHMRITGREPGNSVRAKA
jgi:hypothetical protein